MELQPGDIFATKGKWILGWACRSLLNPTTDRYHFGIIWKYLSGGDFLILESINKGLSLGKLSWYDGVDIQFYRASCPEELRYAAPDSLIEWGRARYDYLLVVKLIAGATMGFFKVLWREHRIRKLRAEDLPYGTNSSLICTEAVDVAYDSVGVNIIPQGVVPTPSAFKQAEIEGRIIKIM